ncbi:MAG TPA: hypothetical protein VHB79_24790 [Polyangiaceae bacterium]|nr:hypothetical protein [Polyangiaceae bacterium]
MRRPERSGLAGGGLLLLLLLSSARPARAHGSFPEVKQILLPADRAEQIILATNFGLIVSEDGGGSWSFSCEHGLSAYAAPYSLGAPDTHRLFAMTSGGVIYSDDEACGWQMARGVLSNVLPYGFTVDASSSHRVYAIGVPLSMPYDGDNIYVSHDAGLSFEGPVYTSPPGSAVLTVLVAPSNPRVVFASMFSAPANHPLLLRSNDAGEHWQAATDLADSLGENPFELLAIDALDENKLYGRVLEASAETLAVSDDGGLSFVRSVSIPGKLSAFLKLASGTILVGGTAGADAAGYRSKDGGQSFEAWPGVPHVHALAERSGKLYVAADEFSDGYVLAQSDDEGAHLEPLAGFKQVQSLTSCVADLCTASCAYYAGSGLWPQATCGAPSTVPDEGLGGGAGDAGAAAGGAAAGDAAAGAAAAGAAAGAAANAGGEAPDARPTESGAPAVSVGPEPLGSPAAGGGCACAVSGQPRERSSTALLLSAWISLALRRRGRPLRPRDP